MSIACGCQRNVGQPHVALALRAAALDSMPRLWEVVVDFFATRACAMHYATGRVLALLPQVPQMRWEAWFGHLAAAIGPVSGGFSAAHAGAVGIGQAQDEALSALTLGERLRGPGYLTAYAEVFPLDYATSLIGDERLREIYENVVTRLAHVTELDRGEPCRRVGTELLATLDAHLATACTATATAARLGIHRNTVFYRLRRISDITNLDLDDPDVRFLVQLALRAYRRRGTPTTVAVDPSTAS